ncbi:DUF3159 domain-containing protein [Nocardia sp. NPDC004860]|uniref:DUF3159 domain-containing protein n=1 Tax=Nocardia sp. NPDC004860 TaxID=3154557 RepID=UPI0033B06AF5
MSPARTDEPTSTGRPDIDHPGRTNSAATQILAQFKQLNGFQRSLDAFAPAVAFLLGYQLAGADAGIAAAIIAAAGLALVRLVRGDSVKVVTASVIAVFIHSLIVQFTGEGRDFFLTTVIRCIALALVFGTSLLSRRPASWWICLKAGFEPAGEMTVERLRLHRRITGMWFANWIVHVLVLVPLYLANNVAALSLAVMVLGKPAAVALAAVSWLQIQRSRSQHTNE